MIDSLYYALFKRGNNPPLAHWAFLKLSALRCAAKHLRRKNWRLAFVWIRFIACVLLVLLCCAGCTTFHVTQTDESPNERIITLDIKGTAWFSSAQNISKLKALQTDKTQSFGADSLTQHGATNSVEALKAIAHILELLRPVP